MSGVWTEKSVPMTDHECAIDALEQCGVTVLSQNPNLIRININGREWSVERRGSRYAVRYNRRSTSSHELSWIDNLSNHYSEALDRKRRRLLTAEETAQLESEKEFIRKEREMFEQQRISLIEERKAEIREKARSLGYKVKESVENGQVRMVLVRRG